MKNHKEHDLQRLVQKPPKSRWPKIIGWSIPVIIIGLILFTLLNNPAAGVQQMISLTLWNGTLVALGTFAAFCIHLSIITDFYAANFISLNTLLTIVFIEVLVH